MDKKQRIYPAKGSSWNAEDRLNIATLLIKAGYSVRIGKEKIKSSIIYFIEFWEE